MTEVPQIPMTVDREPVEFIRPDGTPTSESQYRQDLPEETLSWLYEMMVVTRDLDGEFVNLQRQGELALYPLLSRPGGRPGRCDGVPAQDGLAVSAVPRARRVSRTGHYAVAAGCRSGEEPGTAGWG